MEEHYGNFIFINKYLREERNVYTSTYQGYYKNFHLKIKLDKDVNTITLLRNGSIKVVKLSTLKSIEKYVDKLIK